MFLTLFGGVRGAIFAAIALAAILATWYWQGEYEDERDAHMKTMLEASSLRLANVSADVTVAALEEVNRELALGRAADNKLADDLVTKLTGEREALTLQLSVERRRRATIYKEDKNAQVWADTPVPSALYQRLRRYEAGGGAADR